MKNRALAFCYCICLSAAIIPLTDIDLRNLTYTSGIYLNGSSNQNLFGYSVDRAGDFNGDGISDAIVGAAGLFNSEVAYIIFGNKNRLQSLTVDSSFKNTQGIRIYGVPAEKFGNGSRRSFVSYAGDFNGDGISDIIIVDIHAQPVGRNDAGIVYIIFGKKNGLTDIFLDNLTSAEGIKIQGAVTGDMLGYPVSYAGDVNGDGLSDVILGAYNRSRAYIIYGKKTGLTNIDLLSGLDLNQGFIIQGNQSNAACGVGYAQDINGDGIDDIFFGCSWATTNYLIFGKKGGLTSIDLSTTSLTITQGFKILNKNHTNLFSMHFMSYADDINGDGISDIIIANDDDTSNITTLCVIFGKNSGLTDIDLASSFDSTQGFKIFINMRGFSVKYAGDINGDGVSDVLIINSFYNALGRYQSGVVYVIFGSKSDCMDIDIRNGIKSTQGFQIQGAHAFDYLWMASFVGDMNGDGGNDIIVSTPFIETAYLLFGKPYIKSLDPGNAVQAMANVQNVATKANGIASKAISSINLSNPGAMMVCLVAKMFQSFKYVFYPHKLQYMLEQPLPILISIEGITSIPEGIQNYIAKYRLPPNFEKYEDDFHSSFLVNFWSSMVTTLAILGVIMVAWGLGHLTTKYQFVHSLFSKINEAFKWNFFLSTVIGYYGELMFYTSFEIRTVKFETFLQSLSFVICILVNIAALAILIKMTLILRQLVQAKKTSRTINDYNRLKDKLKNYQIVFSSFKEGSFLQSCLLLVFALRIFIFHGVIACLFDYPVFQTVIITLLGLVLISYLIIVRPFKQKIDFLAYITQEIILEVICCCFLGLAVLDYNGPNRESLEKTREILSEMILGFLMAFMVTALIYQCIQLILIFKFCYTSLKKYLIKNKAANSEKSVEVLKNENIQSSFGSTLNAFGNVFSKRNLDDSSSQDFSVKHSLSKSTQLKIMSPMHQKGDDSILNEEINSSQLDTLVIRIKKKYHVRNHRQQEEMPPPAKMEMSFREVVDPNPRVKLSVLFF